MRNEYNYVPIIKLKEGEIQYISWLEKRFESAKVIPYFEIVRAWDRGTGAKPDSFSFSKVESALPSGKAFFVEIYHQSAKIGLDQTPPSRSFFGRISSEEDYEEEEEKLFSYEEAIPSYCLDEMSVVNPSCVLKFIRHAHSLGRECALRMRSHSSGAIACAMNLSESDYVIYDLMLGGDIEQSGPLFERQRLFSAKPIIFFENFNTDYHSKDFVDVGFTDSMVLGNRLDHFGSLPFLPFGWGDYGGLKNCLAGAGRNPKYHTAFIYSWDKNGFDILIDDGERENCEELKKRVLAKRNGYEKDCLAFRFLDSWRGCGSPGNWWVFSLIRYVDQVCRNSIL